MAYKCDCGAEIIWATTINNKAMPLNAKPEKRFVIADGLAEIEDTYTSHFATCPKANMFRKRDE